MLGLHENGAEAGYRFILFDLWPRVRWEKADWQVSEGQMEVQTGGFVEDVLGESGGCGGGCGFRGPKYDVELGWSEGSCEVWGLGEAAVEFEGCFATGFETLGEGAARRVREKALGCPESDGRGSGAGALERDFAEVEIFGGEVGVGGVVFVEAAYGGIAEENGSAAVGLETVLVRVYDDGVGEGNGIVGGAGFGGEIGGKGEVASVGRVDVDAEFVALLEFQDLVEGVDGTCGGGAEGDDYGSYIPCGEELVESGQIHAGADICGDAEERQAEDTGDTTVGVVGLIRGSDGFAGGKLAGDPEGFEVGEGSAAAEVAEMLGPVEHLCESSYGFYFERGAGPATVECVVVGVDRHGQRVGGAGDGVWRLQHLPGVERMRVGVVVVQFRRCFVEDGGCLLSQWRRWGGRQVGEAFIETALGGGEEFEDFVIRHRWVEDVFFVNNRTRK